MQLVGRETRADIFPFLPPHFFIKQDKNCTLPWQLDRITAAPVGSGATAVATAIPQRLRQEGHGDVPDA